MKNVLGIFMLLSIIALFASCKKDEGKLPNISFKTGPVYVSADVALAPTSVLVVGINASKAEDNDVLKKFTVSKSVNGAAATTVYSQDLSGADADSYSHDYTEVLVGNAGDTIKYTFTVTNRDGLTNQLSITVTVT
ncbi:MAG: VCBS domain-containing protein [Saprospiraceae bacterium]